MEMDDITGAIIDSAIAIHSNPGPGLFESLYEALLACDLRQRGLHVERQRLIRVAYNGMDVEDAFRADLLVEQCVIIEIKSIPRTLPVHTKQLLTYLRLTNLRVGLLLNFGKERMKDGIERVVNNYTASGPSPLHVNQPHQYLLRSTPSEELGARQVQSSAPSAILRGLRVNLRREVVGCFTARP